MPTYKYIPYEVSRKTKYTAYSPISNKILLAENLFQKLNNNETYACLLHEYGHKKHRKLSILINLFFVPIAIFSIFLGVLFISTNNINLVISVMITPLIISVIPYRFLSNRNEYIADDYVKKKGQSKAFVCALNKIEMENKPSFLKRIDIYLNLTHPKIEDRIKRLNSDHKHQKLK